MSWRAEIRDSRTPTCRVRSALRVLWLHSGADEDITDIYQRVSVGTTVGGSALIASAI